MQNFEMKLEMLNKIIEDMSEHKIQILDPDDATYRISGIFYNSEQDKTYFSIALVREEEEEE